MYTTQFNIKNLCILTTQCVFCVLYGSFKKQCLRMQTTVTVWSSQWRRVVYWDIRVGSELSSLLLYDVGELEDLTRTVAFRYQSH